MNGSGGQERDGDMFTSRACGGILADLMVSSPNDSHGSSVARDLLEVVPHFMAMLHADMRSCVVGEHPAHFRTLISLAHHPMTVGELAERFGVSAPTASRTVTHLEERGWVRRVRDERDRRRHTIELTAKGRSYLRNARDTTERHIADMLDDTSNEDLEQLSAGLVVLREVLRRARPTSDADIKTADMTERGAS